MGPNAQWLPKFPIEPAHKLVTGSNFRREELLGGQAVRGKVWPEKGLQLREQRNLLED